jgi:hypothetical protein
MNSFERGGNPLEKIGIGGFSFDTIKVGSILESKRFFGVSKSTGIIRGYSSSSIRISRGNYLLITEVRKGHKPGTKNISWLKYSRLDFAKEARENLKNHDRTRSIMWYGVVKGFFDDITKRKFDYRLKVIESGFNES